MHFLVVFLVVFSQLLLGQSPLIFCATSNPDSDCSGYMNYLGPGTSGSYSYQGDVNYQLNPSVFPANWIAASSSQIYVVGSASAGHTNNFAIIDAQSSKLINTLTVEEGQVAVDPAGLYVYVLGTNQTLNIIDPSLPGIIHTQSFSYPISGVSFSPPTGNPLVSQYAYLAVNNTLYVLNNTASSTFSQAGICTVSAEIMGVATTPDGTEVYATCSDNTVKVISVTNPSSPAYAFQITGPFEGPTSIAMALNGTSNYAYVVNTGGTTVSLLNVQSGAGFYVSTIGGFLNPIAVTVATSLQGSSYSSNVFIAQNNDTGGIFQIAPPPNNTVTAMNLPCANYNTVCALGGPLFKALLFQSRPSRL